MPLFEIGMTRQELKACAGPLCTVLYGPFELTPRPVLSMSNAELERVLWEIVGLSQEDASPHKERSSTPLQRDELFKWRVDKNMLDQVLECLKAVFDEQKDNPIEMNVVLGCEPKFLAILIERMARCGRQEEG